MDIEVDVAVVGGGGAGLAAAAEAAKLGRSVVLIEKEAQLGGSTAWSVGSISATNTPYQQELGIKDTPEEHFEDLGLLNSRFVGRDNEALRRLLVDNTTNLIEWLASLGIVFIGPMPEDPHRYPRMHNVVPNSRAFPYHLGIYCRKLGVDIRTKTAATSLIEKDGKVVGLSARGPDGSEYVVVARGGVVLASGDFSASAKLKTRYAEEQDVSEVDAVNPAATGAGHELALELGAQVVNGDIVRGPILRFIPPTRQNLLLRLPPWRLLSLCIKWAHKNLPERILRPFMMSFLTTALGPSPTLFQAGAILINKEGRRFTDGIGDVARETAKQTDAMAFIVFDQSFADKLSEYPNFISTAPGIAYAYLDDYRRNRKDIFHTAPTLDRLAASIGAPAEELISSVAAYNSDKGDRSKIKEPKFYALGPVKAYVVFTDGGLQVNNRLQVMRDGAPIPGLYASGSVGQGGALLEGHGHHLGWAFVSGRLAGKNCAFAVPPVARRNTAAIE